MDAAVFWSRVAVGEQDDCWLWTGAVCGKGYGVFKVRKDGRRTDVRCHRFTFLLTHGRYPGTARHTCDTPLCCNPGHIVDGTRLDNVRDRVERDRSWQKLSRKQVAELRAKYEAGTRQCNLCREYGLNDGYVSRLVRGLRRNSY